MRQHVVDIRRKQTASAGQTPEFLKNRNAAVCIVRAPKPGPEVKRFTRASYQRAPPQPAAWHVANGLQRVLLSA